MTFTRMDESTRGDWDHIAHQSVDAWSLVPDRILELLRSLWSVTNRLRIPLTTRSRSSTSNPSSGGPSPHRGGSEHPTSTGTAAAIG